MGVICVPWPSGTMIRAEAREGDARCEWERMERSLEITARQYLSDFHLYYLNGLVWSCCNFLATKGYLCYSEESRIFSHPGLMEEILTRETIQIKYALRRTVRICTKESRGSCHTMNIWNQGYFFFFFSAWGKWKHRTTWKTGYKIELLVWKVVFFLCKWVLCPKRAEQGTFMS